MFQSWNHRQRGRHRKRKLQNKNCMKIALDAAIPDAMDHYCHASSTGTDPSDPESGKRKISQRPLTSHNKGVTPPGQPCSARNC